MAALFFPCVPCVPWLMYSVFVFSVVDAFGLRVFRGGSSIPVSVPEASPEHETIVRSDTRFGASSENQLAIERVSDFKKASSEALSQQIIPPFLKADHNPQVIHVDLFGRIGVELLDGPSPPAVVTGQIPPDIVRAAGRQIVGEFRFGEEDIPPSILVWHP